VIGAGKKALATAIEHHDAEAARISDLLDDPSPEVRAQYDEQMWEFHERRSNWLKELANRRNNDERTLELLASTQKQCERYRGEIKELQERKSALADVVADLKREAKLRD